MKLEERMDALERAVVSYAQAVERMRDLQQGGYTGELVDHLRAIVDAEQVVDWMTALYLVGVPTPADDQEQG